MRDMSIHKISVTVNVASHKEPFAEGNKPPSIRFLNYPIPRNFLGPKTLLQNKCTRTWCLVATIPAISFSISVLNQVCSQTYNEMHVFFNAVKNYFIFSLHIENIWIKN